MASSLPVHVVVLQHMELGHPWFLRSLLAEASATWSACRPDAGDPLPAVERCDAVWVMGGAMQVWQEAEHPWLRAEKRFIREAVEAGVPFLGVCLGHQLLAAALGGEVGVAEQPEVGLFGVSATGEGAKNPLFEGCGEGPRLQWHKAEVTRPPETARVLAQSERCPVQAMAVGETAFSLQYHVEVDEAMLPAWCQSDSVRATLDEVYSGDGLAQFQSEALRELPALRRHARTLFRNWMQIAARSFDRSR